MDKQGSLHAARAVVIAAGVLLLLMLTLRWWNVERVYPGFSVEGGTPGRAGIGVVAAICTLVLLVSEFVQIQILKSARVLLAFGALAAVIASALTGSATASYAGKVVAESGALSWPAYAAIVLALLLVAATFVERFVQKPARLALPPMRRAAGAPPLTDPVDQP
jgi:hypothetical protein